MEWIFPYIFYLFYFDGFPIQENLINFFRFPESVLNVRKYQDYIALYIFLHLLRFESYVFQIA